MILGNLCVYDTGTPRKWVDCAQRCIIGGGQLASRAIINNLDTAKSPAEFNHIPTWIGITKSFMQWARRE